MSRAALLLLALFTAPALAKDDPFAGRIAGKPANCVDLAQQGSLVAVDRHTIMYRESGRRIWRTQPVGECAALRPMTTLIVEVYGGSVCRNDRFRVLEPGSIIASGICRFDSFVPYVRPDRR